MTPALVRSTAQAMRNSDLAAVGDANPLPYYERLAAVAAESMSAAMARGEAGIKAAGLVEAAEYIAAGDMADLNPDGTLRTHRTQVQVSGKARDAVVAWLCARAVALRKGQP